MKDQNKEEITVLKQENPTEGVKGNKKRDQNAMNEEGDSSEWSLESLEDIKAVNLKDLQAESNHNDTRPRQKVFPAVKFPQKPSVFVSAPLHEIGKVVFVVGQLLIVQAVGGSFVVDLDNWVSDQEKSLIGFVIDVLGKIQNPYYAIKPQSTQSLGLWVGKTIFYIEGTSKILKDQDIKSLQSKGQAQIQEPVDDSSDEDIQKPERKYSEERRDRRDQGGRRVRAEQRQESRDRTREKQFNRNNSRPRNQSNQKYLDTMYNMHYNEMMRLYNGGAQPTPPNPTVKQQHQPQYQQQPYQHQYQPQTEYQSQPRQAGLFNTNQFFPTPNPPTEFPYQNISQLGSNSSANPFYGQTFQQPNYQCPPNWQSQTQPQPQWQQKKQE